MTRGFTGRVQTCAVFVVVGCLTTGAWALDVTSVGAKGDGKADDTAAFARAFQKERDVHVPPGTYLVTGLELGNNAYLHGSGAASSIVLKSGEGTIRVGNDCRVTNLKFTGQDMFKGAAGSQSRAMITIRKVRDVTVDHVRVENYRYTAVHAEHARNVNILNCHFEKTNWAILLSFCKRVRVSGNRIFHAGTHGIQFWGNWKFENKDSEDLIFTDNYIKDGGAGALWGTGATRVVFANNIVDGASDVGLDLEWCDDATITGNTVRNCRNAGIALLFACRRVAITGNTVINDRKIDDPKASWWSRSGIQLSYPNRETFKNDKGHRDVTIVGNTIHCAKGKRRAIWVGSESNNVTIASNTVNAGGIWHGGHHNVHPMKLVEIKQNTVIHRGNGFVR